MRDDIWRLAGLAAAGALTGLAFGRPVLGLAVGLAVYCYLLARDNHKLYEWLHRHQDQSPPRLRGYADRIAADIESLQHQHHQREEIFSQFRKRFQEAASALPDAIMILTSKDQIEWANQSAAQYLGIRWPQDAHQQLRNLIRHPKLIEYLKAQSKSGDIRGITLPSPENDSLQIEYRVIPYGSDLRLLVARDVSQIQQINQMRRDFIANASHELRTPLTVIAGYLESLDGDLDINGAELQPQIKQMRQQAGRMQTLINDLLMLSTLESRAHKQSQTPVAIADILTSIYREASALSGEKKHVFALDVDSGLQVRGSHDELYSACSNLIVNAVQYTPPGGVIRIRWYEDEQGAHMKVSDTGDGIAPEHLPRLTERFYRVDRGRSRDSGGTGLGLAIVKHIMQRHHGQLYIDSELGKGSIFRCDFPPSIVVRKPEGHSATGAGQD